MSMIQTKKGTKKLTDKEKLAILKEAGGAGVKAALAKYDLYLATFYYWKRKFANAGVDGLAHGITKDGTAGYDSQLGKRKSHTQATS